MGTSMWKLNNIDREIKDSPNSILEEQAKHFEKATNSTLYARIENVKLTQIKNQEIGYALATNFSIVSPGLDNYTYRLCTIYSNPECNYPLAITVNKKKDEDFGYFEPDYECNNETEFTKALEEIIGSQKTTDIVLTLYSKSKNY